MSTVTRRHRAWRRHGGQTLTLVTREPTSLILLAALGRTLFRYRSELAPFTVAGALAIAGLMLHGSAPDAWPWLLAATGLAVTLAVLKGAPWGVTRPEERAYATLASAVAGGWLSAATAFAPWHPPLPAVLAVATLALGVPWWVHRRRRARVRVDRVIQAWPEIAEAVGLAGSRVQSAIVDVWGWRARMTLHKGQTVTDAIAHVPAIESALGTRPGAVRVEADPAHAGRFLMRVLAEDPHAGAIPWRGPAVTSSADPIELGLFEDATAVRVPMLRRHVLIGGTTDSGKSGVLNVVLGNLVACPDVVLWGIDLKGGMELRPWAPCLDRLATTAVEATALLRDAVKVLEARAHDMGQDANRLWTPSAATPALVIVIDEFAELTETAAAVDLADSIARRGRAVAVTLLVATQRPTQKTMGGNAVRSQMSVRVCLRVRERRDVDLILDNGMLRAGWAAHTLDAPGKFYIYAEGHNQPRRARAYLVTDDDVRTTVERYIADRPTLDGRSTGAMHAPEVIDAESVEEINDTNPEQTLWTALRDAPSDGLSVPELMHFTGMRRTWIYDRLQTYANAGRARQVSRGRWRAADLD